MPNLALAGVMDAGGVPGFIMEFFPNAVGQYRVRGSRFVVEALRLLINDKSSKHSGFLAERRFTRRLLSLSLQSSPQTNVDNVWDSQVAGIPRATTVPLVC